jgi:hypothetical protein
MASTPRPNRFEASLFVLGERLHMPVYKIRQEMPLHEFIGWLRHFNGGEKETPIDLTSIGKADVARMFS